MSKRNISSSLAVETVCPSSRMQPNLGIPGSKLSPCLQSCLRSKRAPKLQKILVEPHNAGRSAQLATFMQNAGMHGESGGGNGGWGGGGGLTKGGWRPHSPSPLTSQPRNNRGWGSPGWIFCIHTAHPHSKHSPNNVRGASSSRRNCRKCSSSNLPSAMSVGEPALTAAAVKRGLSSSPAVVSSIGHLQMTISPPTTPLAIIHPSFSVTSTDFTMVVFPDTHAGKKRGWGAYVLIKCLFSSTGRWWSLRVTESS